MEKVQTRKVVMNEEDLNRDPITGTPGAHPVGTGAGAASGGGAGAAIGMVAGPGGALLGAVIGAVAGGLAGKEAAEQLNPTAEEIFWREYYTQEPYAARDKTYEYYGAAYQTGWEGRARYNGRSFDEAETDLKADYARLKSKEAAEWVEARHAALAAWNRIDHTWKRAA